MNKTRWAAAVAVLVSVSCSRLPGPKGLDPESRDFYSKVRYIITKDEREAFPKLSSGERSEFIKEFWERRDPTPGTEKNEFRDDYYLRIEEANRLFREGTTPGWLQDRGRIYMTLGRPDNRETYPRGITFYGKPQEIWWYGNFPVVFIDDNWSGNYQMVALGAGHISEIARAQKSELLRSDGRTFQSTPSIDFDIAVEKAEGRAVVVLRVPYKAIWLKADGDLFKTTLEATLTVSGADGRKAWDAQKAVDVSLTRVEMVEVFEKTYEVRVEAPLPAGAYKLQAELLNKTGGSRSRKSLDFEI